MVDDSHAVGFVGAHGRGTHELHGVMDRVDIITGTLGKALGGASGGYVSGRREIIELLRQRSRPYLFSNSIPPAVAAATLRVLDLIERSDDLRGHLRSNTARFRERMQELGFEVLPGRPSDRAGHGRRRGRGRSARRGPRRAGRLRRGVLLPGRADGPRAHPHPGLGGALAADLDFASEQFAAARAALATA